MIVQRHGASRLVEKERWSVWDWDWGHFLAKENPKRVAEAVGSFWKRYAGA